MEWATEPAGRKRAVLLPLKKASRHGWRWRAHSSPAEDRGEEETKSRCLALEIVVGRGPPLRWPRTMPPCLPSQSTPVKSQHFAFRLFFSLGGVWNSSYYLGKGELYFPSPKEAWPLPICWGKPNRYQSGTDVNKLLLPRSLFFKTSVPAKHCLFKAQYKCQ